MYCHSSKISYRWLSTCVIIVLVFVCPTSVSADINYSLDNPQDWLTDIRTEIEASISEAVGLYNQYGSFNKSLTIRYDPDVPTANANILGIITFGGSRNTRVAMHEIAHTLGVGTYGEWADNISGGQWTGSYATSKLQQFNGSSAVLYADSAHFWPYGLNYDNEDGSVNRFRHIRMVAALRGDMEYLTYLREPVSLTAMLGDTAVLDISAANVQSYQWYREGSALSDSDKIAGATTDTLQIVNVGAGDEGNYYCVISSGSNELMSRQAYVELRQPQRLAWYRFEQNADDSEGTHHGTVVDGAMSYVDGIVTTDGQQYAVNPNGTNYIMLTADAYPKAGPGNGLDEFTYAAWVKRGDLTGNRRIMGNFNESLNTAFQFTVNSDGRVAFMLRAEGGAVNERAVVVDGVTSADTWHHIAATYGADGLLRLYVDGVEVGDSGDPLLSADFAAWEQSTTLLARNVRGTIDERFDGQMDDLQIFNYAKSAEGIAQMYYDVTSIRPCIYGSPGFDVTGPDGKPDCVVNLYDFADFVADWLNDGLFEPAE